MGLAVSSATFMRKTRRLVASFVPLILAVSSLSAISVVSAPTSNAAYTVSNTNEIMTTTGGGGYVTANCSTGAIVRTIGASGISPSNVLTRPTADCFTLNAQETLANVSANTLGGTSSWGTDAGNTTLTSVSCTESQGVVGVVAHKTYANGYIAGFQIICGDLLGSTNRTTSSTVFGWNNTGTNEPGARETITCPAGMFAVGLSAYVGSLMDRIGFKCGTISAVPGAPTITSVVSSANSAALTWTAPSYIGTSAITNYSFEYSVDNGSTWTPVTRTASTATTYTITGLTNSSIGLSQNQYRVKAINAAGTSSASTAVGGWYFSCTPDASLGTDDRDFLQQAATLKTFVSVSGCNTRNTLSGFTELGSGASQTYAFDPSTASSRLEIYNAGTFGMDWRLLGTGSLTLVPRYGAPTNSSTSATIQVSNFDSSFGWSVYGDGCTASINTSNGLVTATSYTKQSCSIRVTTTKTGYSSGYSTAYVGQNRYAVTFYGNSQTSGTMSPQIDGASSTLSLTTNAFLRAGYSFTGWNTVSNGTGTSYLDQAQFTFNANTALYAQWSANTGNSIVYDNQGATTAQSGGSTTYTTGSAISTIPTTAPLKSGYTFVGWFTAASGGTQVTNGSYTPASPYGTVTLYAQWTAKTNNAITYDNQGATTTQSGGSTTYTTGSAITTIPTTAPVKTDYTFVGWFTAASGGTQVTNGSFTPASPYGTVTLYAQWSLDGCPGTPTASNGYLIHSISRVGSCNWTTPTGITKIEIAAVGGGGGAGFGSLGGGGGAGQVLQSSTPITVSANAAIKITVGAGGLGGYVKAPSTGGPWTYGDNGSSTQVDISGTVITALGGGGGGGDGRGSGANGGSGGGGARDNTSGSATTNNFSGFTSYGFSATSTAGAANGGAGAGASNSGKNGGAGVTIWGINVAGGGGGWPSGTGATTYGGGTAGSTTASGTGHGNAGTDGTGGGGGGGETGGSGLVVFRYAAIVNYTYNANNGTGTAPAGGSKQGGTSFTTAANPFTRSGYTFSGWNTAANGTGGTALTENASNTMPISATDIVFYAQWTANTNNSIVYDNQGATTAQSGGSTTYTTSSAIATIPTTAPIKTGYAFNGWFTAATGGTQVTNGSYTPASPYGTVTLYAQWTALSTDSTLSGLSLSTGTLSPTFASNTSTYTASVANGTSSITVTPTRNQANSTIQVKIGSGSYSSVTSGSASGSLSLSVGTNVITVLVTAQDGTTTSTYTVTVSRLPVVPTITKFDVQVMSANPSLVANKAITSLLASNYSPTYSKYQSVQFTVNATTTDAGTLTWQIKEGTDCSTSATAITGATGLTINVMKSIQTYTSSTCYVVEVMNTLNSVTSNVQSTYQLLPQYTSTPVRVNGTTGANNLSGKVGQAYSNLTPFSVSGGGGSWQYYFTNTVPAGLTINVNTGVISGTYTTVRDSYTGTYIVAIDANGGTAGATVGPLTWSVAAGDALTPTFGTPTATADGFTVQISNYDSNFTWAGTATSSGIVSISNTGLVTVTGVSANTSSTATITTTRSNYTSGSATVSATSLVSYSITYVGGAGSSGTAPTSPTSVSSGATFTTPANTYSKAGYTFAGWNDGTNTYTAAATYPSSGSVSGNVTLTATWTANSNTVAFDSQGGSAVSSITWSTGTSLTLPSTPTRSGYTFKGWFDSASGGNQLVKNALNFDGTGDRITIPHSTAFNFTTGLTLEAWINTTATRTQYITTKGDDSFYLVMDNLGRLAIWLNGVEASWYYSSVTINDGNWHHIAATYNGSVIKGYIDGVERITHSKTATIYTGTSPVEIGSRTNSSGTAYNYNFTGKIYDVRYWNVARTASEISSSMNSQLTGTETGLVAALFMNQGAPSSTNTGLTSVTNSVSGADNGTLSGFALSGGTSNWVLRDVTYNPTNTSGFTIFAQWTLNSQTITYAAGTGGSGTAPTTPTSVSYGSTFTTPANTFTKAGHTFAGWNDGTNTYAASATYPSTGTVSGNVTLTATWTANSQTITYAAGTSGTGTAPSSPTTVSYGSTFTTPANTFTRSGYKFAGWSNGSTTYAAGVTYPSTGSVTGDVTLTATWTQLLSRTIAINSSSYFPSYLQSSTPPTITSTASLGIGTKTYTSSTTGICTVDSSTGVVSFVSTGNCSISAQIATDDTYVTATSSTVTFAITASQDGKLQSIRFSAGVISPQFVSTTYSYTVSVNSSTNSLTVTPTVFQSTSTTTVNGTSVTSGQASGSISLNLGRNTILVRGISQNGSTTQTYTITVNRGSTSFTIAQPNGRFLNADSVFGQTFLVPNGTSGTLSSISDIFISFRSPFTGVAGARIYDSVAKTTLLATSGVTCTDADSGIAPPETSADFNWVTCDPFTFTGVTLTAGSTYYFEVFRVSGASTFFMREGEFNYYPDGLIYTGTTPVNPNQLFDARFAINYVDSNASSDSTLSALTISSGSLSPSFATSTTSYTVSVANSVSSLTLTPTQNHSGASITVNGTSVTSGSASGSISLSTGANSVTVVVTAQDGTTSSTYTVVITRAAASRTITYALGGGSGTTPTQANVLEGSTFTTAASTGLTKAGYTFNKWNDGTSDYAVSSTYTVGGSNVTLTATWIANTLTVTYNSQGGSSVTSGTVATDAKILSAPTAPSYAGYTLSGWATTSTGTPVSFTGGYTHGQTANFTLFAIWTANTDNAITYDNQGATTSHSGGSTTYTTATAISTIPTTAPLKTGYSFAGWFTASTGGTQITNGSYTPPTPYGAITLYAQWAANALTISYSAGSGASGTGPTAPVTVNYGSTFTIPANTFSKNGYTFAGWSDGTNTYAAAATYPSTGTVASNVTLTATWSAISCSPTSSTAGGYTIYSFTTAGTCFWTVPNGLTDVEVLAVAGGGGGGYAWDNAGAGGGAGGQIKTGTATLSTTLQVTVGAGGAAGITTARQGGSGGNSVVGTITALGGGGGCAARATTCANSAQATSLAAANGGAGGAGGASGKGGGGSNTSASATTTTAGGAGTSNSYSGSAVIYGAGGNAGTGGSATNSTGITGGANTGKGGGGATAKSSSGDVNGGAGGTGLVIVRVANALTVSFDTQGGSSVSDTSTVTAGIVTEPTAPTRSTYTFLGWFTATSGGSAITFPYTHGQTANFTLYARWSLNSYAVAFNANNGSGTMANQTVTHGVAAGLNANLFTRANYVFYRWATAADGTGTTYSNLAQVTLTAGTTLYAQWTANTYVVTYNYDNATGGASTSTSSFTTGGTAITLPTPTKTGYTFAGWFSDAGLTASIGSAGATYSPTGTTLSLNAYAKWTAIDYTFTYDLNNADTGSVPTETSKQIGQTATIKANTGSLVRAGYTFAGWNTQSNGSGTNYLSGSLFTVQSSNVTLYAKWTANSYTITYNSNGGTGNAQRSSTNVSTDTYTTGGSSITLPGVGTLERTGYTFGGWNTSAAGTGTNRAAADTFTTVSDVIFYAKWNPVTYSITYDGNTSTGGTTPTTGGYTTGQASPYSVVSNTFTKTLHVFGGWNTAADGSGTNYSAGSSITTLSNITLYAIWIPQYTLHYAINGGTVTSGSLPSDTLYNANTAVSPIFNSVSRTGYTFGGWRNGSSTIAGGGSFTIVQDSVLTAIWTPVDYTISYDSDGGTTPPTAFTKQIGQSFEVGSAVIKPGYNFTGWKAGSTTVGAGATVVVGSSNISYTAQWTAKVYRISYDWNGGRGTAVSDVDYTFGTTAITLPVVGDRVKDGYNFAGWAESTNGSALGLTYTPSQTRTLYALWTLGTFTVTYDAGRGTVANSTVAVQNGSATTLPLPTRANFVFNGWHTASTGGTRLGANGDSFTPAASQTVYARWIQSSLYGISDSLSRIGSVITADNVSNTFTGANSNSSVAVSIPANTFEAGTSINFDLVGNSSRATGVLPNVNYIVSIAISWLTGNETVPETAAGKSISVTISNASIKAGAAAYAIINNVSTLLGTATQDGTITISITSDPEIVIAATKPGAPTSVTATSNGAQQSVISWSAPSSNGGAAITGYTVTSNTGATCTTSGTSCTISSLTNGTAYTFTVTATNSVGTGVASSSASATTAALYTVRFDAKGGSSVTAGSFLTASTVSEPTAPTRDGYSFAGWSATDGGSVEVFPYAPGVTTNITMYAKWDALDHAVTFDSKGGSSVTASVFASGGTVTEPTAPTRSGYTFAGWSNTDGGSAVTFPYAPGVVVDITLYAKWSAVSSGGGGSSGGSSSSNNSSSSGSSNAGGVNASGKNNVTVTPPITVVGDKDAIVSTIEVSIPSSSSNSKPPAIKIDSASEKFIAEVKIVDGRLSLTPETGFSGKKTVTVTITEGGADRIVQIPLIVLPEPVTKPVLTPASSSKTIIRWADSPNADAYSVYLDGKKVCSTSASSCSVSKVLGPNAVVEIVSNGGDRTVSSKIEADFKQTAPVAITRIVSATITKATLTKVDTKALDKVIALIKTQGFGTVVISEITTTKKTATLAAARIAAIKKYIDEKTGSRDIAFEVVPASTRTFFNNISVKG